MSGGFFNHQQFSINDIKEEIEDLIDNKDIINEYSEQTLDEFKNAIKLLNKSYIYAQRIDWLISGDDSEESFHERLNEELSGLK
jgi:hypothetical protein